MKRCYVIAEAGVNHNGSLKIAKAMVHAAHAAGADAIKFQVFDVDAIITSTAAKAPYQKRAGKTGSQKSMLEKLALSPADFHALKRECERIGMTFLATPFDLGSVRLMGELGVPAIKIASGELTNDPLLLEIARQKKPALLSTGMASQKEIAHALDVLAFGYHRAKETPTRRKLSGCRRKYAKTLVKNVTLLHCVSSYPVPAKQANLPRITWLAKNFGLKVGYSDHTLGIHAPQCALALGACVIEKHFTLDKTQEGPDHAMSLLPSELRQMIASLRESQAFLLPHENEIMNCEAENLKPVRRSLVALKPIVKGQVWTPESLGVKRPGGGTSPQHYWEYLGKKAKKNYQQDEMI